MHVKNTFQFFSGSVQMKKILLARDAALKMSRKCSQPSVVLFRLTQVIHPGVHHIPVLVVVAEGLHSAKPCV